MEQKFCRHIDYNHPPTIVNHTFDHRPPMPPPNPQAISYYGSLESYRPYVDCNEISNAMPGRAQGLYHPDGPLQIGPAYNIGTILTEVKTTANISLTFKFVYNTDSANKTVEIKVGDIYTVTYLEDANLKRCTGKISDIWKVYDADNKYNYYKIKIDCSVDYSNNIVVVKNDQIRGLTKYVQYADEDTTISNSVHNYGTTIGLISAAVVTNATVDANGNILDGTIVDGTIEDGYTIDGIAKGENSSKHSIMVINGYTLGGTITNGRVMTAVVRSGDIDGTLETDTNITVKATVKGILANVVISNSTVSGGKTTKGTFLDPTLVDCIVYNAQVTGDDMVTTGGITCGNITTGGTTTGGTGTGGTASGIINGKSYTIEGGTTNVKDSSSTLITSGGVVTGGTIIGGIESGNMIIGAVIKGGVATNGTTVNGTTTGGSIIPAVANPIPLSRVITDPDYSSINADRSIKSSTTGTSTWPTSDDLIVFNNMQTCETTSNLGTAKIQGVETTADSTDS